MNLAKRFYEAGKTSYAEKDFQTAAQWFELAVRHDQLPHESYYYWALCCLNLGELLKAERLLKFLCRLQPLSIEALYALGIAEKRLGRPKEAMTLLSIVINRAPNFSPAYSELSILLLSVDKTAEAREMFEQCKQTLPEFTRDYCRARPQPHSDPVF